MGDYSGWWEWAVGGGEWAVNIEAALSLWVGTGFVAFGRRLRLVFARVGARFFALLSSDRGELCSG